jgi:hypothetical protein
MSETTTTAHPAATPPRRIVSRENRDWGVTQLTNRDAPPTLIRRKRAILAQLLTAIDDSGRVMMTSRAELRTSANMMQELYYAGWVNGAGSNDARGQGNTPASSWWWLTTSGEALARTMETKANV